MVSLEELDKSTYCHLHLKQSETGPTTCTLNISQLFELIVFIVFVMVTAVITLLNMSNSF